MNVPARQYIGVLSPLSYNIPVQIRGNGMTVVSHIAEIPPIEAM
jgi:hypothetical protein